MVQLVLSRSRDNNDNRILMPGSSPPAYPIPLGITSTLALRTLAPSIALMLNCSVAWNTHQQARTPNRRRDQILHLAHLRDQAAVGSMVPQTPSSLTTCLHWIRCSIRANILPSTRIIQGATMDTGTMPGQIRATPRGRRLPRPPRPDTLASRWTRMVQGRPRLVA